MTKREELERYYEDRDMAENDLAYENDQMTRIEQDTDDYESDPEWQSAWDEATSLENEISCLSRYIADLEEELEITE